MNKIFLVVFTLAVAFLYIVFFNVLLVVSPYFTDIVGVEDQVNYGADTQIGFGDNVEISVRGKRLFGLAEFRKNEDSSKLYIFYLFPLPLEVKDISFVLFHKIFFGVLLLFFVIFLLKPERRDYDNDGNILG